jgi:hypothetical protein
VFFNRLGEMRARSFANQRYRALYSEFCGHPITVLPTTPVAARIGRYALFEDEDDE